MNHSCRCSVLNVAGQSINLVWFGSCVSFLSANKFTVAERLADEEISH